MTLTEELFQWLISAGCMNIIVDISQDGYWEITAYDGGIERNSESSSKNINAALTDLVYQVKEDRWHPPLSDTISEALKDYN